MLFCIYEAFPQATKPFKCENRLYYFTGVSTISYIENYTSDSPIVSNLCDIPFSDHNGLGANSKDMYLYFTSHAGLTHFLYKLDSTCNVTPVCDLISVLGNSVAGGFDLSGMYWTVSENEELYAIDITSCNILKGPVQLPIDVGTYIDVSYNVLDGKLYIQSQNNTIYKADTNGVILDTVSNHVYYNPVKAYGSGSFGCDGKLYGANKAGNFSAIDLSNDSSYTFPPIPVASTGQDDMAFFQCADYSFSAGFDFAKATLEECALPVTYNFYDTSIGNYILKYKWDFGDSLSYDDTSSQSSSSYTYAEPGVYSAQLLVYGECYKAPDTASINIEVEVCSELFFPNAFSPNGDGINDTLLAKGDNIKTISWSVYDRRNNKIFETQNKNVGWDGLVNGKPAAKGIYAYQLHATFIDDPDIFMKGNIFLGY